MSESAQAVSLASFCFPSCLSSPVVPAWGLGAGAYLSILEHVQTPRGVVFGPYLSYPALLIDVEVAFLPKEDLGTPAPAVTHH